MSTRKANIVHIVLDDFGTFGRAYVETDERETDRDTIIRNLMDGQYVAPVRIIAFDLDKCDVSADIAREVVARAWHDDVDLPEAVIDFCEDHDVEVPEITTA